MAGKVNRIGLEPIAYKGGKTTLCAGCGHNAISERIIEAMYEMGVKPERLAKFSGIGCSSKSPAYFLSRSHSFNAVHGRMPAVATGSALANHTREVCAHRTRTVRLRAGPTQSQPQLSSLSRINPNLVPHRAFAASTGRIDRLGTGHDVVVDPIFGPRPRRRNTVQPRQIGLVVAEQ